GFIIARFGMPYMEPATFLFLRFTGVLIVMGLIILFWKPVWPTRSQTVHIAIAGALLQFGYVMGVWSAVRLGMTAGLVAIIVGLQPIITAWSASWVSERVSYRQWLGLLLGIGGVGLVVIQKTTFLNIPLTAYVFAITALFAITFGTLYQKKYCPTFDLRAGCMIQFSISMVLCLMVALAFETREIVWNTSVIGALLWGILPTSIGAISLLFILIRKGAATKVTSLLYLTPPTTALMAWILFDEPLTLMMLTGLMLTMTAVILVNYQGKVGAQR
ncbi:MAG: DMT family transporter, partial [Burkholderiaceae bacterium]|nr:DMT family transporter [Burkholderiaceae bacterium]